jgi:hypothetical protein
LQLPPEQVIGSSVASEFQLKDGKAGIVRLPKIGFVDDKALDVAASKASIVVDLKKDWKTVFPAR